jgi:hypothetical protein
MREISVQVSADDDYADHITPLSTERSAGRHSRTLAQRDVLALASVDLTHIDVGLRVCVRSGGWGHWYELPEIVGSDDPASDGLLAEVTIPGSAVV